MRYDSKAEKLFQYVLVFFLGIISLICLYPLIYVASMSISDPIYVARGDVWLWPVGFSTKAYEMIMERSELWTSYGNTLWYTCVGTIVNVTLTMCAAYPLSRKEFFLSNGIMMMITFTMFFSGGLIPSFILVSKLGMYNSRWALIIPSAIGAYYVIIARTFFQSIPQSLMESAKLDGANDIVILRKIVIPLSMPLVAVLVMYYAVRHWNSYFDAMVYIVDKDLQPMQLYLRRLLIENTGEATNSMSNGEEKSMITEQIKYAVIVVTTLPILCVYPFLQKHFVKGVMIGAIKA